MKKDLSYKVVESTIRSRIPHVAEYYDLLKYEVDPLGGYRLRRNQRLPHVTISEQGYRGRNFSGSETMLLLGDSVAFGVGASSDEACLARFLERTASTPVADGSVRAYRVSQHFGQLPRLLSLLPQLRTVVLWTGYADLLYWATTGGCIEGAFQFERKYSIPVVVESRSLPFRWAYRVGSAAATLFLSGNEVRSREKGTIDDLVRHMNMYAIAIRDLCHARQINLKFFVQPFIRSAPSDPELRLITDFYDAKTRSTCGTGWYDAAEGYVFSLLRELNSNAIDAHDLQIHVSEGDFIDQVHLHERAVESVSAWMTKLIPAPGKFPAFDDRRSILHGGA